MQCTCASAALNATQSSPANTHRVIPASPRATAPALSTKPRALSEDPGEQRAQAHQEEHPEHEHDTVEREHEHVAARARHLAVHAPHLFHAGAHRPLQPLSQSVRTKLWKVRSLLACPEAERAMRAVLCMQCAGVRVGVTASELHSMTAAFGAPNNHVVLHLARATSM